MPPRRIFSALRYVISIHHVRISAQIAHFAVTERLHLSFNVSILDLFFLDQAGDKIIQHSLYNNILKCMDIYQFTICTPLRNYIAKSRVDDLSVEFVGPVNGKVMDAV